ncbi:hypothetical protein GCK32_022208 [Trichostrongylus colubriformis]|uniref:Uncharacterized protein n=1 Tax=Trichostrongylus colubriformis TaxID=6319 RepID=A0AAN8FF94_TRICO
MLHISLLWRFYSLWVMHAQGFEGQRVKQRLIQLKKKLLSTQINSHSCRYYCTLFVAG